MPRQASASCQMFAPTHELEQELGHELEQELERFHLARVLQLLGRGVIAFHPRLVKLTGSATSALMLSQTLYWTRILYQKNIRDSGRYAKEHDGWFWKTRTDWSAETSLSRHEQDSARQRLRQHPFWQEKRTGMPARLWFSIDLDVLARALDADFTGAWDWADEQALSRLLGRPLLLYRTLADLTGSVSAALLLSRMLMDVRIAYRTPGKSTDRQGWSDFEHRRLMQSTGLTRAEFYGARKKLREQGFIDERCTGLPAKWQWRLDLERIAEGLERVGSNEAPEDVHLIASGTPVPAGKAGSQMAALRPSSMRKVSNQECGKTPFLSAGKPHTENPDCGQQGIRIPAIQLAAKRTPGWPVSGFPYKGLTTVNTTTSKHLPPPPHPAPRQAAARLERLAAPPGGADAPDGAGGGGNEDEVLKRQEKLPQSLIWPNVFLETERETAAVLLSPVMPIAQTVLDELAGQACVTLIHQPLAYLKKLVEQVRAGTFLPVAAQRIQAARARQAIIAATRNQHRSTTDGHEQLPTMTDELRATGRRHIEELNRVVFRRGASPQADMEQGVIQRESEQQRHALRQV